MRYRMGALVVVALVSAACAAGESDLAETPGEDLTSSASPSDGTRGESTSPASRSEPCSFVGDEAMSGLLGKPVAGERASAVLCRYAPNEAGTGGVELLVQDVTATGCELPFSVGGFDRAEPVEGVGTYARFKGSGVAQLAVCFDEQTSLVVILYADASDPRSTVIGVAKAVEASLP